MPAFCRLLLIVLFSLVHWPALAQNLPDQSHSTRWRLTQIDGVHWLTDPDGNLFYSKGVNFIDGGKPTLKARNGDAFFWGNFYPSAESWRKTADARLRNWGFNTRGGWSDPSSDFTLALTVDLELGRNSRFHWFDPFRPDMGEIVIKWAHKLTAPYRNDSRLLGYYIDNEVGWWNSPLFAWYLGKAWDNHTKQFLWNLIYRYYAGSWQRLLADWVPTVPMDGFEDLKREGSGLKLRPGGTGIRMVDLFMRLYCEHYYRLMFAAIRQADPAALILGDRLPLYYHQDAVLAINDNVDVISTNYNIDVPDGWVAPYYFDGLRTLAGKPVLVTEYFFAAHENRSGNLNRTERTKHPKPGHLMTVQTQSERAYGVMNAIRNFAGFPNVVGIHWFQYCDEPRGGREDGENYNMGLIDLYDRPYEQLTDVFQFWNPRLDFLHQESFARLRKPETSGSDTTLSTNLPYPVRRARYPIAVKDQSLEDWDKVPTRLQGLQAPPPYVPFGDIHLSWTPEGLYVATIANTYVDPQFLAYSGEFPKSEAFQIHLLANVDGKASHHVVYLVPQLDSRLPDGFDVKPKLYKVNYGRQVEVPTGSRYVQRIKKSLPHMMVETFIPSEWLGIKQLYPGQELELNLAVVSYFRELGMSWSAPVELGTGRVPSQLKKVILSESNP